MKRTHEFPRRSVRRLFWFSFRIPLQEQIQGAALIIPLFFPGVFPPQDTMCSAELHPRSYVCRQTPAPLAIDGKLDEPVWAHAAWTDDFVDIEGERMPRPRFRTRAKMLWDNEYFYIGALLEEPHVWATLRQHDTVIFIDNDFEVFIDPDGDNHEYYEFEMNALNTGWDLFLPKPYRDGGSAENGWDIAGLKTAVHIEGTLNDCTDTDTGWSVEIAIPWNVLAEHAHRQTPPAEGNIWRINFSRVEWDHDIVDGWYRKIAGRPEHNWVWSPQGVIDMHRPEQWGYVQFVSSLTQVYPPYRDPFLTMRAFLMKVYYAQKAFFRKEGRWASTLSELGVTPGDSSVCTMAPVLELTDRGYQVKASVATPDGKTRFWSVREDSKLRVIEDEKGKNEEE